MEGWGGDMRGGWYRLLIAGLLGLALAGVWSQTARAVDEGESGAAATSSRASRAARGTASAEQSKIDRKLQEILKNQEQILANQQTILSRFDAVMDELRIVKVRASQ